ncbi:hypothetical protein B6R26_11540 [Escherichia coli]|nr:hypothetical protein [Escherichia coli]EFO2546855.1 hypothetical protein [Escherichia coli]EFO2593469.1 hypothetical protein [Escherichia coli]EFO2653813.1 hypothetical protein [Escherichia coli]
MKTVTFYLIMVCDFKFVLWINCEAELIREEKQKKTPQSAAFGIVCIFLAGCGVNASPGLVGLKTTRLLSPRYHAALRCG